MIAPVAPLDVLQQQLFIALLYSITPVCSCRSYTVADPLSFSREQIVKNCSKIIYFQFTHYIICDYSNRTIYLYFIFSIFLILLRAFLGSCCTCDRKNPLFFQLYCNSGNGYYYQNRPTFRQRLLLPVRSRLFSIYLV